MLSVSTQHIWQRGWYTGLREFEPTKESIKDFKERFEFYCTVNNIRGGGGGEHAW